MARKLNTTVFTLGLSALLSATTLAQSAIVQGESAAGQAVIDTQGEGGGGGGGLKKAPGQAVQETQGTLSSGGPVGPGLFRPGQGSLSVVGGSSSLDGSQAGTGTSGDKGTNQPLMASGSDLSVGGTGIGTVGGKLGGKGSKSHKLTGSLQMEFEGPYVNERRPPALVGPTSASGSTSVTSQSSGSMANAGGNTPQSLTAGPGSNTTPGSGSIGTPGDIDGGGGGLKKAGGAKQSSTSGTLATTNVGSPLDDGTQSVDPIEIDVPDPGTVKAKGGKNHNLGGVVSTNLSGKTGGPSTPGPIDHSQLNASATGSASFAQILEQPILVEPFRRNRLEASVITSSGQSLSLSADSDLDTSGTFIMTGSFYRSGGGVERETVVADISSASATMLLPIEGNRFGGYDRLGRLVALIDVSIHQRHGNDPWTEWFGRATYLADGAVTHFSLKASGDYVTSGAAQFALDQIWSVRDESGGSDQAYPMLPAYCVRMLNDCETDGQLIYLPGILGFGPQCEVKCPPATLEFEQAGTMPFAMK